MPTEAGRIVDDIDRPQLVVCSVHEDRETALDMARLMVTQYLGQQPHIMKASGVPQSLLDEIGEVLTWPATHEQVVAASKLVPDEIVQMLTAVGHAGGGRAKVAEYVRPRLHLPDPLPARRRAGDDRRLRRLGRHPRLTLLLTRLLLSFRERRAGGRAAGDRRVASGP